MIKKFTYGYIFMMAEGVVLWKSVKQTFTTSSTMEAEYVACYEYTYHVIWLRNFIQLWGLFTPFLDRENCFVIIRQLYLSLGTLGVLLPPSTLM